MQEAPTPTQTSCDAFNPVADLITRGGTTLHVRPAHPADLDALADLFRHVSAEDLRFRFMDTVKDVDANRLGTMLRAEAGNRTFLAFAEGVPIACCTLAVEPDGEAAEVTLSVRSDWKGQGVSWTLLEHVVRYAGSCGIKRIVCLESGADRVAINLEREMGFVARLSSAEPVELTLSKLIEQR